MQVPSARIDVRLTNIFFENDEETSQHIVGVDVVREQDMTEFTLESLPLDDSTTLVFYPPLVLVPELSECKQYMMIEYPELGIDAVAQTRDELWDELAAWVRHLWIFCAKEPDERLGHLFIKTKRNLLAAITEVQNDRP